MRNLFLPVVFALFTAQAHAEIGVSENEIIIGQSAAFSGPSAALGTNVNAGAQAYFDKVNREGGIHGRRIKLMPLDDGYEADRAAKNTEKLIKQFKVFALFAYVGTPTSLAALPIFNENNVPFFGAVTGAEKLRSPFNRNIFNVRASYFDETREIVKFLGAARACNTAVVYQNDSYGQAGLAGVVRAMEAIGCKPIGTATIERNSLDVSKAVETMAELRPNGLIIISAYKASAEFSRKLEEKFPGAHQWNVSFVGTTELVGELGEKGRGICITQVVPYILDSMPLIREHRKALGAKATFTSLEGYINAAVFVEALRRAGRNLTREGFINTLETNGDIDLNGYKVSFSRESHNGSKFVTTTMITRNGKVIQ